MVRISYPIMAPSLLSLVSSPYTPSTFVAASLPLASPDKSLTLTKPPPSIYGSLHGFGTLFHRQWRRQSSTSVSLTRYSSLIQRKNVPLDGRYFRQSPWRLLWWALATAGLLAYNMAGMRAERVDKVAVASYRANIGRRENEDLVRKAKLEGIGDLMLPQWRSLLGVTVAKRLNSVAATFSMAKKW